MTMELQDLLKQCKADIEQAARESYNEGNVDRFDGCCCMVDLGNGSQVGIDADRHGGFEVVAYHEGGRGLPNVEAHIADYLYRACDVEAAWRDEYDNDYWRGVDPGCDPAFPHYGDFERWAYGR